MSTADTHILEINESPNANRVMQILLIAAIAASGLSMLFSIGTAMVSANGSQTSSAIADQ